MFLFRPRAEFRLAVSPEELDGCVVAVSAKCFQGRIWRRSIVRKIFQFCLHLAADQFDSASINKIPPIDIGGILFRPRPESNR